VPSDILRKTVSVSIKPAPALKQGVHPENLRILPDREVRVALLPESSIFCSLWPELKEAGVSTFGAGASLTCDYGGSDFLWYRNNENGVLEFPEVWYDIKDCDSIWGVQQGDHEGRRNFALEVLDGKGGLAHRVSLKAGSDPSSYLEFVRINQASLDVSTKALSWWGFQALIRSRHDKWKSRTDLARRVERNRVIEFLASLANLHKQVRLTVWNGVIKHSRNVEFQSWQMRGHLLEMYGRREKFTLDSDRLTEAWVVQCRCFCGEEILEMYDYHGQLMASIVFSALSQSTMNLLPALN